MSNTQQKSSEDTTRLGDCAAMQPLSGVKRVDETFAVNGSGRGGYARMEENQKAERLKAIPTEAFDPNASPRPS